MTVNVDKNINIAIITATHSVIPHRLAWDGVESYRCYDYRDSEKAEKDDVTNRRRKAVLKRRKTPSRNGVEHGVKWQRRIADERDRDVGMRCR